MASIVFAWQPDLYDLLPARPTPRVDHVSLGIKLRRCKFTVTPHRRQVVSDLGIGQWCWLILWYAEL
jgi:hypothetical protein